MSAPAVLWVHQQFYECTSSSMSALSNSNTPVTSSSPPPAIMATLQTSCRRILRGLQVNGHYPFAPTVNFGGREGVLGKGAYPLARRHLASYIPGWFRKLFGPRNRTRCYGKILIWFLISIWSFVLQWDWAYGDSVLICTIYNIILKYFIIVKLWFWLPVYELKKLIPLFFI